MSYFSTVCVVVVDDSLESFNGWLMHKLKRIRTNSMQLLQIKNMFRAFATEFRVTFGCEFRYIFNLMKLCVEKVKLFQYFSTSSSLRATPSDSFSTNLKHFIFSKVFDTVFIILALVDFFSAFEYWISAVSRCKES